MRKTNNIKIAYILICGIFLSTFTGCGLIPSIELNEEQTEIVAEYAAGLLAKYEKGHSMGLVGVNNLDIDALYATPTPTPIVAPTPLVAEEPEAAGEDALVDGETGDSSNETNITLVPLSEAFGFYDSSLDFTYIERCETYPQSDDQLLFSMNATEGNDLAIAHFNLTNNSSEEKSYLTNLNGYKVRFVINNEDRYRCDFTILSNDLTSFAGKLAPGETVDAVLIFDIPKAVEITSLNLVLVNGQSQLKYDLYQ